MRRIALCLAAAMCAPATSQIPFFPGAEGFGGSFLGTAPAGGWFSNATVYRVTNLNDSGPGSLRGAFQENTANRIILFDVAGTINLTSGSLDIKNIENYYIAGQSAPGEVTVTGDTVQITHSNNRDNTNIALRYLTFRKGTGNGSDAITFAGGSSATPTNVGSNMILDHVTATWAEDENLSIANNNTNITVQHSIIADATGGTHSYGSLARPRSDASVSIHHNLYANNTSRQPRLGSYNATLLTADVRNNVIYNWSDRASYAGGSSEAEREYTDVNYVGNYLVAGPWTTANANRAFVVDKNITVQAYQFGNFIDSDRQANPSGEPNGADTGWGMFQLLTAAPQSTLIQMAAPFPTAPVTTQSALDAYRSVIAHAGNSAWQRDSIDQRITGNVVNLTAPSSGPNPAGPIASELAIVNGASATFHPAGYDTDGDGIPNSWEVAHGLNPNSTADWNLDFDADGYVNLIEYLNWRGEFPATAPLEFTGGAGSRYARIENWRTNDGGATAGSLWQPSRHDTARVRNGSVVVDAVGQYAGVIELAPVAGDNAMLSVASGWLKVTDRIVIGASQAATATLAVNGGLLEAASIERGVGGVFSFTSGELRANSVGFDLTVQGGMLSPGLATGALDIDGDLTLSSGALSIDLAPESHDSVAVAGVATLGGQLVVAPAAGFTPSAGVWRVLTADQVVGDFASVSPGYSTTKLGNEVWLSVGLAGDFNGDLAVDAADYSVWRDGFGTTTTSQDFAFWSANYGRTMAAAIAVPEASTRSIAVLLAALSSANRRRTSSETSGD